MSHNLNTSSTSLESINFQKQTVKKQSVKTPARKKQRVNWHEAVSCAIQIELQAYADFLEYEPEYILGKNSYRIDLLVIKKLTDFTVPKNIARIFSTFNLFEIKGIGSSASISSYYKTIGYAGLLINQTGKKNQYSSLDVSLTLLSLHYPRKLMKHLIAERKIKVETFSKGIYYISKETFTTQIIVTQELLPEENLYLRCLTDKLQTPALINRLTDDYILHSEQDIYIKYMHQLATANIKKKGNSPMVCEGILNLCGTSSEEIIERTKQEDAEYYLPQIDSLTSDNKLLSAQNDYLKALLEQNNIPFNLNFIPDGNS
ncbi:MAG: hypothetical protein NC400_06870 [Clostridium sp.]|nr:hypothetical protein [Clostridium sp.]